MEGSGDKTDGVIRVMQGRLLERSDFRRVVQPLERERRPVRIAALNLEGERRMAEISGEARETIEERTFRCCCVVAIDFVQHGGLHQATQPGTMAGAKSGRRQSVSERVPQRE